MDQGYASVEEHAFWNEWYRQHHQDELPIPIYPVYFPSINEQLPFLLQLEISQHPTRPYIHCQLQ